MDASTVTSLPDRLDVGTGTAFAVAGTASDCAGPGAPVLELDGEPQPTGVRARGPGRWEWWSVVSLPERGPLEGPLELRLRAGAETVPVGGLPATSSASTVDSVAGRAPARIAICLATHEPDLELLATQLESIAAQDCEDWVCVISDDGSSSEARRGIEAQVAGDSRYRLLPPGPRLGFYGNFERALRAVPEGPGLIALADQDDRWYPQKLSTLAAALDDDPGALLVHSNYDVVDRAGRPLGDIDWMRRSRTEDDLIALLFCNTVTGAAAMMRRELLGDAIPFPPAGHLAYHDHWLALCARALAGLRYLPEPLYARTAHEGAVTTGVAGPLVPRPPLSGRRRAASAARRLRAGRGRSGWRAYHHDLVLPGAALARTLELRLGDRLAAADRADLPALEPGAGARGLIVRLVRRARRLRRLGNRRWGREHLAARGLIWARIARPLAAVGRLRTTIPRR